MNDYAHAEQLVKKQVKRNKDDLSYKIDLGYIYSQMHGKQSVIRYETFLKKGEQEMVVEEKENILLN